MTKRTKNILIISLLTVLLIFVLAKYAHTNKFNDERDIDLSRKISGNTNTIKKFDGLFLEYSPEKLLYALDGKVVLFFNASWCPTCSQFVDEIKELKVPDNVLILSVDYDKNQNLRQKYKVAYQHTFVEVDQDGKEMYRWSGGGIDRLKKELSIE